MNGAEILIESLKKEGVEVIFGIPGGALLPVFDALYKEEGIRFLLTRHEQAAAHMADGYSRATGKVGVCMATSGPGATNLTTGLATAYMDSIPMVAITGQVATSLIGNDAFQEADTTGITRPITKYNYLVRDVKDLAKTVKESFYIAKNGRPGPVLIDLPADIQRESTEFKYPEKQDLHSFRLIYTGHSGQIKKALMAIEKSEKPLIYAGGGIILSEASKELLTLVNKMGIPVTTTLMGMGAFPSDHPLSLGMLGMHGTKYANYTVMESDLIIAIGARFDDRVTGKLETFAPKAKFIHIDIDPSSIDKIVKTDIPIVGDAKNILGEFIKSAKKLDIKEWQERVKELKRKHPLSYKKDNKLRPQYIVEKIWELTKGKAIISTEVGQNQMWAAQFYRFSEPRTFLSSGGLGTMGYGFPAAIGAQIGMPDKIVFDIAGDGSFQMNIQELNTAVINRIPVKVAILNNCYLGMVRQWQELFYGKRYSSTYLGACPDFSKIAQAFGAKGRRITKKNEVEDAIREALKEKELPFVLDFRIEKEENVFPMVPAGASLDEMI